MISEDEHRVDINADLFILWTLTWAIIGLELGILGMLVLARGAC